MPNPIQISSGDRYGRLMVVGEAERAQCGQRKVSCVCDCGKVVLVFLGAMRSGNTLSCGCLKHERAIGNDHNRRHGYKGNTPHPLYLVWNSMISRCYNPKATGYDNWGGRGIRVCKEWREDPAKFIQWSLANGWAPDRKQHRLLLDRENNDLDYSPDNCRFVTPAVSLSNRRPKGDVHAD